MKFYDPPEALLPKGDRFSVELAGAKCLLAIDESKNLINIETIFSEISRGEFWQGQENLQIQDQIEKINILKEDAEALYNPDVLAKRVSNALETIRKRNLLFLGVASFEGNAFETAVFDEMELNSEDQDRLMNLYKVSRKSGYPDLNQEYAAGTNYVEINFFGKASSYFTFPNKKNLKEMAAIIFPYNGYASGIVTVAQGAANFIFLTDNIFKTKPSEKIHIDRTNFEQMFRLIRIGVLEAPISWFKIDLGIKGLNVLPNWEDIQNRSQIENAVANYKNYLKNLIIKFKSPEMEQILDEDLGTPIHDISLMSMEEIEQDLDACLSSINVLNEFDVQDESISLFSDPPKILFAYGDQKKVAIGGGMSLLSVDVGGNICAIADLRENVSWGEYDVDDQTEEFDDNTFIDILEDSKFLEMHDPTQLRDTYINAFQQIMQGSEIFLGILELESNAFNFSLFHEVDVPEDMLKEIRRYYHKKIKNRKFPKLEDRRIKVKWYGEGKHIFSFTGVFRSILDIAEQVVINDAYQNGYAAGIVATSQQSASFFILANNFYTDKIETDLMTLNLLLRKLEDSNLFPLCWFKITLGMQALRLHPYWKGAFQYDTMQIVLENYRKYLKELRRIKTNENQYRIY